MSAQSRVQAAGALRQIAYGLRASQALHVAAQLNVADRLAQRPMDAGELALAVGVNAGALGRVMRALCALNVFSETAAGQFSLLPPGELLRSDVPGSYRAAILFMTGDVRWRCWADLLGAVRTGSGSAERTLGLSLFDFYAAHPEDSELHDQAMRSISAAQVAAVLRAYDFSQMSVAVDVGGGTGELLAAILAANPSLTGILFDLPHVVAHAEPVFRENGVDSHVRVVGGSFFESVPSEGDAYIMKTVIHDWDDTRASAILKSCRRAMKPESKLLIMERELPESGQPARQAEAFLLDLEMLVMTPGGRERTRSEFAQLLSGAGLQLGRVIPTESALSIFEARPV